MIRRESAFVLCSRHIDAPIGLVYRDLKAWSQWNVHKDVEVIKLEFRGKDTVIEASRSELDLSMNEFSKRYISPAMCALLPRLPEIC